MPVRLGIVVRYRDRPEHLAAFVPHLRNFFRSDPLYAGISARILISEQSAGLPFNRGLIKNVGFSQIADQIDYVCFHDVDLLPVSVDYRPSEHPSMLISEGLDFTPDFIRKLFGGVVLMDKAQFVSANGFSNNFWGWGFEDVDLRERLLRADLQIVHRTGRFTRLPHIDEGSSIDGAPTQDHLKNKETYANLWFDKCPFGYSRKKNMDSFWMRDGLSSVQVRDVHPCNSLSFEADGLTVEHVLATPVEVSLQ